MLNNGRGTEKTLQEQRQSIVATAKNYKNTTGVAFRSVADRPGDVPERSGDVP